MLRAQDIMNQVAALLNDQALTNFTYTVQIPHLNIAIGEMKEEMERNNVQASNNSSATIVVLAGATTVPLASLPTDLIEIQELWERTNGSNEDYLHMDRREFLPPYQVKTTCLLYWTWASQNLNFLGALSDRQLRIDYVADALPSVVLPTDPINLINASSFLQYRTASRCARYVMQDGTRADSLDNDANLAFERFISINTKGKQAIATRRRPYRSNYRHRGSA